MMPTQNLRLAVAWQAGAGCRAGTGRPSLPPSLPVRQSAGPCLMPFYSAPWPAHRRVNLTIPFQNGSWPEWEAGPRFPPPGNLSLAFIKVPASTGLPACLLSCRLPAAVSGCLIGGASCECRPSLKGWGECDAHQLHAGRLQVVCLWFALGWLPTAQLRHMGGCERFGRLHGGACWAVKRPVSLPLSGRWGKLQRCSVLPYHARLLISARPTARPPWPAFCPCACMLPLLCVCCADA